MHFECDFSPFRIEISFRKLVKMVSRCTLSVISHLSGFNFDPASSLHNEVNTEKYTDLTGGAYSLNQTAIA